MFDSDLLGNYNASRTVLKVGEARDMNCNLRKIFPAEH